MIEVEAYLHAETPHALLVSDEPHSRHDHVRRDVLKVWLPKSQVTEIRRDRDRITFEAPEWLLVDRGLDHLV